MVLVDPQGYYSEVQEIDWVGCIASLSPTTERFGIPRLRKLFLENLIVGKERGITVGIMRIAT